ncbi:hypothetical protein COEREDRAFT_83444 [Coemansia reversa NRRL 1564]|uniref:Phosphoglycerate mutase-like protein n=1 Tax=Coemansia reversa (strain ATCC 12441 / NRRL 1564) TaxID=763665 RepID=A0A2G5B398_COERN|nr:hypothetical protein COEREDRAFT_83444 [Coemansia reversa NRRL 1564]|eukprot:PIA13474.1 hypothetical protein COEREDRAFT_83444 [Coemansia reversa NRRL 1564]
MDVIPLPLGGVTCYFVRHGERIDHIDETWVKTAQVPYDPPLTAEGNRQAQCTGAFIQRLEQEVKSNQNAGSPVQTEFLVLTSPFLRCAQTAEGIYTGFQRQCNINGSQTESVTDSRQWKIAVEPGLSEVMNENYFDKQLPDTIISERTEEIVRGVLCSNMQYDSNYTPTRDHMPEYPEHFQDMMARFVSTLDHATSVQLDRISKQMIAVAVSDDEKDTRVPLALRKVVIIVTHGAGIGSLLWATTMRPGANELYYCCLSRAQILARRTSQPLQTFGKSRIPAYEWMVDLKAYTKHLPNL